MPLKNVPGRTENAEVGVGARHLTWIQDLSSGDAILERMIERSRDAQLTQSLHLFDAP